MTIKKINRKTYGLHSMYNRKSEAVQDANRLRSKNLYKSVRVSQDDEALGKGVWGVWKWGRKSSKR